MQQESFTVSGVRPARSLVVALLLGSAALVGLVCLTKGESVAVPSAPGALVLPVFPLLEEADALQAGNAASRRAFLQKAAAATAAAVPLAANAKAGQFSKIDIFSVVGEPPISSPYQPGGPKAGKDATFGYKKSDGPILATGYETDVTRELAAFKVSRDIINSQQKNVDGKVWWLVRDNMRGQAYNMKANMKALNSVLPADKKAAASKAYDKFWKSIDELDLACRLKELELAQANYKKVKDALAAYEAVAA
jgi:hypothetical protein